MEISILMMIVIAIVAIYLIFKFIKKMIFAVISAIMVVILLFAGVIGIAVYDVKSLSEKTDFNVNLAYYNQDDYVLGATLSVKDSQVDVENFKTLKKSEFDDLDYTNLEKDGNDFVIKFDRETFENIITLETYTPSFMESLDLPTEISFELTKTEVLDLIESKNALDELSNKLLSESNVDKALIDLLKPELLSGLEDGLSEFGVSVNEAIFFDFLMSAVDKNEIDYLEVLTSYKNDNIEIYPNRLTFSLVKMLPSSFVQTQIESVTGSDELVE